MAERDVNAVDHDVAVEFLRKTLPFCDLEEPVLRRLARECVIDFHPKGVQLFAQGETAVDSLYLVQQGGVRVFQTDEDGAQTLIDFRGEHGVIGGQALSRDGLAHMNAETVEDTFFFKLRKEAFLDLIHDHPFISRYFLKSFSDEYVSKAFDELRIRNEGLSSDSGLYLFSSRIGEVMHGPPVRIPMGRTIQQAAGLMVEHGIGSILVTDPSGEIIGIVTDKDLRKIVSVGMDYGAPIETIMSSPVETVDSREICFDALIKMMTMHIHHLAVEEDSRVAGMVTSHDIMVIQGKSPMSLFREILSQRSLDGVHPLARKVPQVVRTLVEEGAKAGNITRMITVINDLVLEKILTLLLKEMGPPPLPFCWMLMGSEGRKEQTFATDQDNALVYKDCQEEIINRAAEYYFKAFTEKAIENLVKCGFPPCPGEIMARNPKWRQPYMAWRDYFENWISIPEPQEVLHAAIFFDFRGGFGQMAFAAELRNHIAFHCRRSEIFLRYLAADCLKTRPPLSFFKNFIVEKDGEHKNTLDIKKRGLAPMVDFARVMALRHEIKETNTLVRLEMLEKAGFIQTELYTDAREAFEFMMQIRLVHQLELVERGKPPDNFIAPGNLSDLEKRTLKEAFGVIGKCQSFLKEIFRLNMG